jgi:thiamine-monophosphate kinase
LLAAAGPASSRAALRVPPGDDAAVLADGSAWTLDPLVEGVHFTASTPAEDVGFKTVAVSVSDLGAMGARPHTLLLGLSVPPGDDAFVAGFARGVGEAVRRWGLVLAGGDVTRSPGPRVCTSTLGGPCVASPMLRSGARVGDRVWVTGALGWAGMGWATDDPPPRALRALRRPDPPVAMGLALAETGVATAAMDLSDGLAADLPRLCLASGVAARVDPTALPGVDSLQLKVRGGEDFELLFTASPDDDARVLAAAADTHTEVTPIGVIVAVEDGNDRVTLLQTEWPPALFSHFGARS